MANVSFHGNVGKVKEIQLGQDGKARLSFSVAEGHSRFNKQSNQWEDTGTTWRNVTMFGKRAEALAQVLREGAKQKVVVMGREETRNYEHNGEQKSSLDCVADFVGLLPATQAQQLMGNPPAAQAQGWNGTPPQQQGGGFHNPSTPGGNDPWSTNQQPGSNGGWGSPNQTEAPF